MVLTLSHCIKNEGKTLHFVEPLEYEKDEPQKML